MSHLFYQTPPVDEVRGLVAAAADVTLKFAHVAKKCRLPPENFRLQ
jgi:hypothetical protein